MTNYSTILRLFDSIKFLYYYMGVVQNTFSRTALNRSANRVATAVPQWAIAEGFVLRWSDHIHKIKVMYYIMNRDKNFILILCNTIAFLLNLVVVVVVVVVVGVGVGVGVGIGVGVLVAGQRGRERERRERERGREGGKQVVAFGRFLDGFLTGFWPFSGTRVNWI